MDWDTCKKCIFASCSTFWAPNQIFFLQKTKIADGKLIVDTSVDRERQDGEEQTGRTCGKGMREYFKYHSLGIKCFKEYDQNCCLKFSMKNYH